MRGTDIPEHFILLIYCHLYGNHDLNEIICTDFCTLMYIHHHYERNTTREVSYLETMATGSESVHCIHLQMFLLE